MWYWTKRKSFYFYGTNISSNKIFSIFFYKMLMKIETVFLYLTTFNHTHDILLSVIVIELFSHSQKKKNICFKSFHSNSNICIDSGEYYTRFHWTKKQIYRNNMVLKLESRAMLEPQHGILIYFFGFIFLKIRIVFFFCGFSFPIWNSKIFKLSVIDWVRMMYCGIYVFYQKVWETMEKLQLRLCVK